MSNSWCFWTVVLEKTLEIPLDSKEIQLVHPKGNKSWIFIGRTDAEAETSILWPPNAKSWLIGKDPFAGKDWRREEKGMTEDEMVGWHQWMESGTWVWAGSGTWWWTGRPGMLQSMGSQRVRHDWATDLNHFFWGLPLWPSGKESTCNAGDAGSIPESEKSPGRGNSNLLQYSCLENSMERRAWQATVSRVSKVRHDWATEQHTHNHFFYTVKLGSEEPKYLWGISIR